MRHRSDKALQVKFIIFVIDKVAVSTKNLIMAELCRTFYARHYKNRRSLVNGAETYRPIATEITKYLVR